MSLPLTLADAGPRTSCWRLLRDRLRGYGAVRYRMQKRALRRAWRARYPEAEFKRCGALANATIVFEITRSARVRVGAYLLIQRFAAGAAPAPGRVDRPLDGRPPLPPSTPFPRIDTRRTIPTPPHLAHWVPSVR